jgi:inosine-uridine nucleoside N-ribohydrolase
LAALALGWALSAGAAPGPAGHPPRKVIVDQDSLGPGGTDMQSILMVIQAPEAELLGITVESGDGWQKENVAHALRLLELIGRTDIPVVPGAVFPLVNSEEETRRWEAQYGRLPYKGAWTEQRPGGGAAQGPPRHGPDVVPSLAEGMPATRPSGERAADFLIRKVREYPGEVTILAMGPFTNLALAIRLDPEFAARPRELVLMGCSFNPRLQNPDERDPPFANNPRVEFNVRWDPEAAKIVLNAPWRRIIDVPLDATAGTALAPETVRLIGEAGTPAARYVARYASIGMPMWDEIAAAGWLDPGIVRRGDPLDVDVDIGHGADYGATLCWAPGAGPGLGERTITVVRSIDVARFEKLFSDSMCRRTPLPVRP